MAIIYTNQSSGAIRRMKKRKPTKAYKEALKKHIKYLQKLGFNCDDNGRIQLTERGGYYLDVAERTYEEPKPQIQMSNKIGHGGTKPDNSWKIEASKNFTIVPAYNKGPYMVVNKSDLKTAGRKV
tara:strand:- start:230 stop:604 length:375 start_codon:yes stop_codon:yes gene_type:complete